MVRGWNEIESNQGRGEEEEGGQDAERSSHQSKAALACRPAAQRGSCQDTPRVPLCVCVCHSLSCIFLVPQSSWCPCTQGGIGQSQVFVPSGQPAASWLAQRLRSLTYSCSRSLSKLLSKILYTTSVWQNICRYRLFIKNYISIRQQHPCMSSWLPQWIEVLWPQHIMSVSSSRSVWPWRTSARRQWFQLNTKSFWQKEAAKRGSYNWNVLWGCWFLT